MGDVYKKLEALGLTLPQPAPALGLYKPVRQEGKLLYVSGQGSTVGGRPTISGQVGGPCSLEEGQKAAQMCGLNALAALHHYLGDLNRIKGVVKVLGFIASAPGFGQQPRVLNGCSQLLKDLWGEDGVGARSAIGVNELPDGIACEVEFIFELRQEEP